MSGSIKSPDSSLWPPKALPPDRGDRLDSWKEIANYLRREVRTVQLWEKNEGLPVRRHFHKQLGSVFAFRSEIDTWARHVSRKSPLEKSEAGEVEQGATDGKRISIGILPVEMATGDREREEFCAEIVRKTITTLKSISPDFICIVPLNAESDANSADASLSYLVKTRGQFNNGFFDIELALVSQETKASVWSYRHRWGLANTPDLANAVVEQMTQCLWLKLVTCGPPSTAVAIPQKQASREAYLTGRFFWNQRSEEGMRKAIRYFESAIQADPTFALAYSGLADCLTLLSFYEISPPSETMPAAKAAVTKALELDPDLAEAHTSLADVYLHFDRNWIKADEEYRRAIECNPGYALAYHWYANLLIAKGHHEAAQMAMTRALEIDPISPTALVWAGVTSHLARRYDEAIDYYKRAVDLNPHFVWAYLYMAQSLEQKRAYEEALKTFDLATQLAGEKPCITAMRAHTYAKAGDKPMAMRLLGELNDLPETQSFPAYDIAAVHAALGQPARSIKWLRRACKERSMRLFTLTQDPRFDSLRELGDFQEFLLELGLSILPASGTASV